MNLQKRNMLAHELLTIIKHLISENDLVKGVFIADVKLNESEDTIIVRDVTGKKTQYSLSEASYIFTDNLDMLGSFNKNVYKNVKASEDDEKKSSFMNLYERIREIEDQL